MTEMIKDGTGNGYLAKVNKDNQLITRATALNQHTKSAVDGNYYEAHSGVITLGDAVETGIIYIKNGEDWDIIIDKVFVDVWASTAGTGGGTLKYYKNPTITGGTDIIPTNTNFSKTDSLVGTFKKSLTTMTGGTTWWVGYFDAGSSVVIDEEKICIPKGYYFGISITAPTGNTSMNIAINIAMYKLDITLIGK